MKRFAGLCFGLCVVVLLVTSGCKRGEAPDKWDDAEVVSPPSGDPPAYWKEDTLADKSLSVWFPNKENRPTQGTNIYGGEHGRWYGYAVGSDLHYYVGRILLKPDSSLRDANVSKQLDLAFGQLSSEITSGDLCAETESLFTVGGGRDAVKTNRPSSVKVEKKTCIKQGDALGRDYLLTAGDYASRMRTYAKDDTVYIIHVTSKMSAAELEKNEHATQFLNSLRILGKGADVPDGTPAVASP